MYLENDINLAEVQRLQQKIGTLDENLKLKAEEVKAKSEGEYTMKLLLRNCIPLYLANLLKQTSHGYPFCICCNLSSSLRILH